MAGCALTQANNEPPLHSEFARYDQRGSLLVALSQIGLKPSKPACIRLPEVVGQG